MYDRVSIAESGRAGSILCQAPLGEALQNKVLPCWQGHGGAALSIAVCRLQSRAASPPSSSQPARETGNDNGPCLKT